MYYGQRKEDQKIRELLGENDPGFYIDIGAWHPDNESVTKHFYERGWCGINVEPVKSLYDKFVSDRPRDINIHAAIGLHNEITTMRVVLDQNKQITGLSTLHKKNMENAIAGRTYYEETVVVQTLEKLCEENVPEGMPIDFLKIDVEGYEKDVIYSGNWKKFRPKVLCIESTVPCTNIRCDSWDVYVQIICQYQFICFDGLNNFYKRNEEYE